MSKRIFNELKKELELNNEKFTAETLKLLRYRDLTLAGCGNAGNAICNYELIKAEEERRLSEYDNIPFNQLSEKANDNYMLNALFHRRAKSLTPKKLDELPFWLQMVKFMQLLRGNWSCGRRSIYFKKIVKLIPKVKEEGTVPLAWVCAVELNTEEFDGHYVDGRIFRDGSYHIPKEYQKKYGLNEKASGNLASFFGIKNLSEDGYCGGYDELFKKVLSPELKVIYYQPVSDYNEWEDEE